MGVKSKDGTKMCEREDTCGYLVSESTNIVKCDGHQTVLEDTGGRADRNEMDQFLCNKG